MKRSTKSVISAGLIRSLVDRDPHHRVGVAVVLGDLRFVDFIGQFGPDPRHGVADVVRRLVDITAGLELDHRATARRAGSMEVMVLMPAIAGDGALDHLGDVRVDDLGRGAGVGRGHADDRRIHVRQLADRQAEQRGDAEYHDQHAEDGGEDRPFDAEVGDVHGPAEPPPDGPAVITLFETCTGSPSRSRCKPLCTTMSPAPSPSSTSTLPASRWPSRT